MRRIDEKVKGFREGGEGGEEEGLRVKSEWEGIGRGMRTLEELDGIIKGMGGFLIDRRLI